MKDAKVRRAKELALLNAQVAGSLVGHRKGTKVHKDKRRDLKNGYTKHKGVVLPAE